MPARPATQPSGALAASLGLAAGGVFWGLFWIPVRYLEELGLHGAWPGLFLCVSAALALTPVLWHRRQVVKRLWRPLALCGLYTGAAFAFYAIALNLSEVVRVILLFYLTPIWGTLLGLAFLGERLTLARTIALISAFGGLLVVLGAGQTLPFPKNLGDWLALASGLLWALGSLHLFRMSEPAVPEQMMGFLLGASVVTGVALLVGGNALGGPIPGAILAELLPYAPLAALYLLPMLWLTVWPLSRLTPGRAGLILMSEAIVGVASAALLSGEPFGLRQTIGSTLIIGAALVEILGNPDQT